VIALEEVSLILLCNVPVRDLRLNRTHAAFSFSCLFLHSRPSHDATLAAVVANTIHSNVVDDGFIHIHVADNSRVHTAYSGVVVEVVSAPVAAFISAAVVAEAIIDTAIKADVRTPVSGMP
jgi:hypothetical protein